jgi:hypothetical protein
MADEKDRPLTTLVELTEREAGQLMCLLHGGYAIPERDGFNMTEQEQSRLGEKCRRAVWRLYHFRKARGLPTELDKTGVLEPEERRR